MSDPYTPYLLLDREEVLRLRTINAELLAAFDLIFSFNEVRWHISPEACERVRKVIAKAKGETA